MKHCQQCKTELPEKARFCNKCGSRQTVTSKSIIQPIAFKSSMYTEGKSPATPVPPVPPALPARSKLSPITPPPLETVSPEALNALSPHSQASVTPFPPDSQTLSQNGQHLDERSNQRDAVVLVRPRWIKTNEDPLPPVHPQEVIRSSTPPPRQFATTVDLRRELDVVPVEEVSTGPLLLEPEQSPESLAATRKAAERWRNSWRERQRATAGSAVNVSRGQASVPMPLVAMQHSFARLRSIIINTKQTQQSQQANLSFWVALLLMLCLIGGLGVYIISTYLPSSSFGADHIISLGDPDQPALVLEGSQTAPIISGQMLHVHGEHFNANHTIIFLLDSTTPILDTKGKPLTVMSNNAGLFNTTLRVGSDWLAGVHLIQAQDSQAHQNAYLNIQVSLGGTPSTYSPDVALSAQQLTFRAVLGEGNPAPQLITLTNTSGRQLQWSATATAGGNLNWLIVDYNHTHGILDVSATDTLAVNVLVAGLASNQHPYTGQITFTMNGAEQLTLPVELSVQDAGAELVLSPNPIIAQAGPGGTCAAGAKLTLINLSNVVITWNVNPDTNIAANISFLSNGKPALQGQLEPAGTVDSSSGQRLDTSELTLVCSGIQSGMKYHITVSANGTSQSADVVIQP